MATVKLYSVSEQKLVDYELSSDLNGELIASHEGDFVKFPGGISKEELMEQVKAYNDAAEVQVPLTEDELAAQEKIATQNDDLLKELEDAE